MPQAINASAIPFGSPMAKKHYAGALFTSTMAKSWVMKNLIVNANRVDKGAQMANAPIVVLNDLTKGEGDAITYDLYMQITGAPTFGDDNLEGNLETLSAYSDEITINQVRHGVDVGGRMSNKRTVNDNRAISKTKLTEWFANFFDQTVHMELAGRRGQNPFLVPKGVKYAIRDTHEFEDYDADHLLYGGMATSKASLTADDKFGLAVLDEALVKACTEGGDADNKVRLTPLDKNGEDAFMCIIHPYQLHDLRHDAGTAGWLEIQKAAAGSDGQNSPLFKNKVGEYRGITIKTHKNVSLENNYGAGGNIKSARASFMGRQALVAAFGNASSANLRADWTEKTIDVDDNKHVISGRMMFAVKRPRFNDQDVNSYAIDTAADKPKKS
ncbi:N4-gp56 family major capsid protein [Acinetobacter ursingii]|uniref:N4-gp56 family major capsid protein n=1 Tax=Acinetobacter ursingii TaxID=108980 RepID=UPI00124C3A80|nr:N4-gp56 family major capsid protein [Acinetobacter ursingii]